VQHGPQQRGCQPRGCAQCQERHHAQLALFGSTIRDTATRDSDVDVLVAFDGPATSQRYFGVQFFLEDLFGCPVDLVTEKALRAELRPFIEKERVIV
jgi:predicted nucleotidyltransferase